MDDKTIAKVYRNIGLKEEKQCKKPFNITYRNMDSSPKGAATHIINKYIPTLISDKEKVYDKALYNSDCNLLYSGNHFPLLSFPLHY